MYWKGKLEQRQCVSSFFSPWQLGQLFEIRPNPKCPFYSLLEGKGALSSALVLLGAMVVDLHDMTELPGTSWLSEGTWQWKLSGDKSNMFNFSFFWDCCLQTFSSTVKMFTCLCFHLCLLSNPSEKSHSNTKVKSINTKLVCNRGVSNTPFKQV